MFTIGGVALLGMIIGQILGDIDPIITIKYQCVIAIAIFVMLRVSLTLTWHLILKRVLPEIGKIKMVQRA